MLKKLFPQNGKKVPEIRFEGFDGDWEQKKLGEMFCSLQNNTLSRADLSIEQGEAKNIHYGDILVKFGEMIPGKITSPFNAFTADTFISFFAPLFTSGCI
mgnify:CR=1 FL=1